MSNPEVANVEMNHFKSLLTCPLCDNILRDATSVVECLHTFCRNCICKKIMEEDLDHCPVCDHDLGCHPLERLRTDMHRKNLSENLLPKPVDAEPPIPLPTRRKERSLSSLGFNTTGTSRPTRVTARRSRSNTRNNSSQQNQNSSVDESNLANANEKNDLVETKNLSQNLPVVPEGARIDDFSNRLNLNEVSQDAGGSSSNQEADLWKPLSSLADAAIGTRTGESIMEEDAVKLVQSELPRLRSMERGNRNKPHVAQKETAPAMSVPVEPRRLRSSRRRAETAAGKTNVAARPQGAAMETQNSDAVAQAQRASASASTQKTTNVSLQAQRAAAATENTNVSAQAQAQAQAVVASNATPNKLSPIWFSLTPCDHRRGFSLLPQIPSKFIKVRERDISISFIQKYLAKKLDLASDTEVQVFLGETPVPPTLLLDHLLNYWLQTAPKPDMIQTSAGSSGEDFVLPLSYARIRPL